MKVGSKVHLVYRMAQDVVRAVTPFLGLPANLGYRRTNSDQPFREMDASRVKCDTMTVITSIVGVEFVSQ